MTQIEKIIRKHYLKTPAQWERCGNAVYDIIHKKEDEIRNKGLNYKEECKAISQMANKLEGEYNSFFISYSPSGAIGFDWIHGNDKLKSLLK